MMCVSIRDAPVVSCVREVRDDDRRKRDERAERRGEEEKKRERAENEMK
jgi:hypothetical protein